MQASKAARHLHTRHGLQLNHKGKQWLADLIAKQVEARTLVNTTDCPESEHEVQTPPPGTETLI